MICHGSVSFDRIQSRWKIRKLEGIEEKKKKKKNIGRKHKFYHEGIIEFQRGKKPSSKREKCVRYEKFFSLWKKKKNSFSFSFSFALPPPFLTKKNWKNSLTKILGLFLMPSYLLRLLWFSSLKMVKISERLIQN